MLSNNILAIEKLNLRIGDQYLISNLNLFLSKGSRIGITGPSGCGKTTLLRSIISDSFPKNSTYLKYNKIINGKIGYIPQTDGLLPWFSIRKNLEIYLDGDLLLFEEIIEKLDINSCINNFPDEISGGEHQRILIGCSILSKPDLYIADEPLTEVDLVKKWKILKYWSEKITDYQSSLILISHDIDTLIYMCDEILVMSNKPSKIIKKITIENEYPREQKVIIDSKTRKEIYDIILNNK